MLPSFFRQLYAFQNRTESYAQEAEITNSFDLRRTTEVSALTRLHQASRDELIEADNGGRSNRSGTCCATDLILRDRSMPIINGEEIVQLKTAPSTREMPIII